ncbi:MAG: hypothetical protein A2Y84_02045 [Candidatus Colwellbacteria bacterium RBG_13_48_8]|uniref:Uncharacterized protein n=1 Tax=Candidatus Colwellbacteria bacterium RBG_13_48_8 TaxID=1797685 RepID=A0A1G1YWK5_9BACT|nr:MAG: hypothetical protein A2Y84_02045 [Candidatus Colwellbacteria bacterium RBG_13_48_8]
MSIRNRRIWLRVLEFFVIGVIFGVTEDFIAIKFAAGAASTLETLKVAFWVALPFAIFSELVVDHPSFWKKIFRFRDED